METAIKIAFIEEFIPHLSEIEMLFLLYIDISKESMDEVFMDIRNNIHHSEDLRRKIMEYHNLNEFLEFASELSNIKLEQMRQDLQNGKAFINKYNFKTKPDDKENL